MMAMGWMVAAGLFVVGIAYTCVRALDGASAAARHAVWTVALTLLVALPLFQLSGARIEFPVPAGWVASAPADAQASRGSASPVAPGPVGDVGQVADGRTRSSGVPMAVGTSARGGDEGAVEVGTPPPGPARSSTGVGADVPAVVPATDLRRSEDASGAFGLLDTAVLVWAIGTLGLLLALFSSHIAAWRLTTVDVERASPALSRRLAALCVELGIRRRVRLVVSPRVTVPATWGIRTATVVLPPQAESWAPDTVERVMLHELAHIQRGDCWTSTIGGCARALHWPNPLVWMAARLQRAESEFACDDQVLARGQAASAYAEDLLSMVRSLTPRTSAPAASMSMARPGGVGTRVRSVLDPNQRRGGLGLRAVGACVGAAVLVAFCATVLTPVASAQSTDDVESPEPVERPTADVSDEPMPAGVDEPGANARAARPSAAPVGWSPQPRPLRAAVEQSQELCVFRTERNRSTNVITDDDGMSIRWETNDCRLEIEIDGDVEFAADDRSIVSMERGARFDVEERDGDDRRRARFEGTREGIERRYWVDGDEETWGAEADAWIGSILPELFRHTTLNAEPRVERFLREGGPDRVFDEVAEIHSDHVLRTYLELMLEMEELDEAEYARVIDFAAEIDSDHSSGELLLAVVEVAGLQPAFQGPMLRAAEGIDSDHQKTRVLQALLASDLSSAQIDDVLESARTIESDHNLGMVLAEVATSRRMSAAGRGSFLRALETIESDHNHGLVLEAFLDTGRLSGEELRTVLQMMRDLDSDHTRASLLQRIASEYELDGAQLSAFLNAAAGLGSDHQIAMTAQSVIDRNDFSPEHLSLVLTMADRVSSDHQRALILERVILREELSPRELGAVLDVATGLGSDHQLGSTLTLILEDETLDDETILDVLDAAGGLASSHQRSTVLLNLARIYPMDAAARDRYLELTDDLSRNDRERARSAIRR